MRERGVSTVGAVVLVGLAGTLATVLAMDWMMIDLRTPAPDSMHLRIPMPLVAGRVATALVPVEAMKDARVPRELRQQRELVMAALVSLAEGPDGTLWAGTNGGGILCRHRDGTFASIGSTIE